MALTDGTLAAAGSGRRVVEMVSTCGAQPHALHCSRRLGRRRRGGVLAESCGHATAADARAVSRLLLVPPRRRTGSDQSRPPRGSPQHFIEADSLPLLV